jgi:KUP system potassium uptake protein
MIAALGVVYGDIGTSPLYAFKQSVDAAGGVSPDNVYAILSLIFWSLLMVVTIKYVTVIMRADNKGEGGTFALTALALDCVKSPVVRFLILTAGLFGAALFYGDSVITPAISVLSAIEGLDVATAAFHGWSVPITLVLIAGLFMIERYGTAVVGRLFGPVMVVWFLTIAITGLGQIIHNPSIFFALDPRYGLSFLINHTMIATAVLGAVVLAVTGGEALFADMGHFGRDPINKTWLYFVFPSLVINYFGQGALVLSNPEAIENPFYLLAPSWTLVPMVFLSAAATIIASQAVISGAFSITNQAVQLGYIPRIRVRHTSAEEVGQIYVSQVNVVLFLIVEALVVTFRTSDNLGSAYGIAVTGTMAVVTLLAGIVMVRRNGWPLYLAIPVFSCFFVIDVTFFGTNLLKFFDGGWFPLCLALFLFFVMAVWIEGRQRLLKARWKDAIPLDSFLKSILARPPIRVPGTSIFMVAHTDVVPNALLHNLKHNRILHERVILMKVAFSSEPTVSDQDRIEITHLDGNFHIVKLNYGFFEEPKILRVLAQLRINEFKFKLAEVSFFIGAETLTTSEKNMFRSIATKLFIVLHRNMMSATDYFRIPPGHVVELGGHIEL